MRTKRVITFSDKHRKLVAEGWTMLCRDSHHIVLQGPPPELEENKTKINWWEEDYDEGVGEV